MFLRALCISALIAAAVPTDDETGTRVGVAPNISGETGSALRSSSTTRTGVDGGVDRSTSEAARYNASGDVARTSRARFIAESIAAGTPPGDGETFAFARRSKSDSILRFTRCPPIASGVVRPWSLSKENSSPMRVSVLAGRPAGERDSYSACFASRSRSNALSSSVAFALAELIVVPSAAPWWAWSGLPASMAA